MEYILYTTYYVASDERRNEENAICLKNNIAHPLITKIYLFLQNDDAPDYAQVPKVETVQLGKRPEFADFFAHSNADSATKGKRKVIANSDIYFTDTLSLLDEVNLHKKIITLTRWDLKTDGSNVFYNKYLSQDVWIFEDRIPEKTGRYYIGQHGCDNRLLKELDDDGFHIENPSLVVKTIHVHMSEARPYFDDHNYQYVPGPYLYSFPSGMHRPMQLCWWKITDKQRYNRYAYNLKDYFYIRFEYNLGKSKNALKHFNFTRIERAAASFKTLYYYLRFKIS